MTLLLALWSYRGFILTSVQREFQSKYRNSLFGATWMVLNPMAMIFVYTVIFSKLMHSRLPGIDGLFTYSIYLCAGVLTWGFFAEIVGRAHNVFIDNANLIKKLSFPRLCLPLIVVLNASLNFSIVFALFIAFLLASGTFPGWVFLAVLPVLLIQVMFSIGLGMTLGVLNVFFRDVGQFIGIFMQFWFWLTPIVYPVSILPEVLRPLMALNPMASLMAAYQTILVSGQWPQWHTLWPTALLAVLLCVFGFRLFKKRSGEMVDEL